MTNQARVLDYTDVRTSRKASTRFGHSQYAEDARAAQGRSRASSSRGGGMHASRKSAMSSKMEQTLRGQRKRKASRQFDRSGYGRSDDNSSSGTRAALHTGSMGLRQRRASRSYAKGSPNADVAKAALGGFAGVVVEFVSRIFAGRSMKFYVLASLVASLALFTVALFPAVQDYYIAVRTQAQAQAEYEALQEYYGQVQREVEFLSTEEGVETRAHQNYGWIMPGDNSVMVQGTQIGSGVVGEDIGIVPSGSVKAPETWYSGFLDPFFGYQD